MKLAVWNYYITFKYSKYPKTKTNHHWVFSLIWHQWGVIKLLTKVFIDEEREELPGLFRSWYLSSPPGSSVWVGISHSKFQSTDLHRWLSDLIHLQWPPTHLISHEYTWTLKGSRLLWLPSEWPWHGYSTKKKCFQHFKQLFIKKVLSTCKPIVIYITIFL